MSSLLAGLKKKRKSTAAPPLSSAPPLNIDQSARLETERAALTPCTINLSDNVLNLASESGLWELKTTESDRLRSEIKSLQSQLSSANSEITTLKSSSTNNSALQNTSLFKSELLLDMLAVSQADNKKSEAKYEKERVKGDEWRKEVERLYKLCEKKGVDTGN
ncbi:hypothetical protein TrLO_g4425 [Triparma laevis f. longispina]|uniref:Uncharacterized protein n=1 Tax=Triparma laevis f. longispina TaxID=1714387 RepID=A0A9W7FMA5_9STRA|nr:hypothetical protein TrLO_g4425 [Triparma laevis f. longispina]